MITHNASLAAYVLEFVSVTLHTNEGVPSLSFQLFWEGSNTREELSTVTNELFLHASLTLCCTETNKRSGVKKNSPEKEKRLILFF